MVEKRKNKEPSYNTHCRDCGKPLIVPSWTVCNDCTKHKTKIRTAKIQKERMKLKKKKQDDKLGITELANIYHYGNIFTLQVINTML